MKLRNLFLASLAICAMTSCSKDEDGPSGPQEMDAYFSIAASAGDLVTKASVEGNSEAGEATEQAVKTLTAFVFKGGNDVTDEDATLVISKKVTLSDGDAVVGTVPKSEEQTITAIKHIHVKVATPEKGATTSATQFQVVLVANTDISATSLADLKAKSTPDIKQYAVDGGKNLPMSSAVLTLKGLTPYTAEAHNSNWYVDNSSVALEEDDASLVMLTRAISRVQIESLSSDFKGQYAGASFVVDFISLVNVRATETIMREENTTAGYYRGGLAQYEVIDG